MQVNEHEFRQDDLGLTSVPRDRQVESDKVKVECNGDISANTTSSQERRYSDTLRRKVDTLNAELTRCRQLITDLQQNEQNLRQRLTALAFLACLCSGVERV